MKNLKEYIVEGIFDTDENTIDKSIKDQIKCFLKENFKGASLCKISDKPNKDGKYEVSSSKNIMVKNFKITSLTNGLFIWTTVGGEFNCDYCPLLTSLEGAPKEVGGNFYCNSCKLLTSLKGVPEKVGRNFSCDFCKSLTSLKGAPKEVGGSFGCGCCDLITSLEGAPKEVSGIFDCGDCESLTSLKGAPKEVGGNFRCKYCKSLTSLEGAPEKVGGIFYCGGCGIKFTNDDVKKASNVKGIIYV